MTYTGTEQAILALLEGERWNTQSGLIAYRKFFDGFSAQGRANWYTKLVRKLDTLPQSYTPFERLSLDIAEVRTGTGAMGYLLTGINPTDGYIYSSEYNTEAAVEFLFGNHKPDLRQSAIAQPRNWTKALTVKEVDLETANYGQTINLNNMTTSSLQDSDFFSEWMLTIAMFFDSVRWGVAKTVTTPPPVDEISSRAYNAYIGSLADWISKPSDLYNPERMLAAFPISDLRVVIRTTTWETIQKTAFSGSFNKEYMRGLADNQYITIPDQYWPLDLAGVSSVVISKGTKPTVLIVDNKITNAASVNAPWDSVNQTRTHRSVMGINPQAVMVIVKDGPQVSVGGSIPVPTTVDLSVELNGAPVSELIRGYTYKIVVNSTDENGFVAGRSDVTLVGAESPTGNTFIQLDDQDFYIGLDDNATSLTLNAASVFLGAGDEPVTATITLPVVGTKVPLLPPFEPVVWDENNDGNTDVFLTPTLLGTVSGNTITPPTPVDSRYNLVAAGTVGGVAYASAPFTAPITLTTAGDTITVTATAATGYELIGGTTRTLTY